MSRGMKLSNEEKAAIATNHKAGYFIRRIAPELHRNRHVVWKFVSQPNACSPGIRKEHPQVLATPEKRLIVRTDSDPKITCQQFVENVQLNFPGQLNKRLPRKSAEKPKQVIIPRPVINRDEPIADPIAFNLPLHRTRPAEKKQSVIEEIDNEDEPPAKRRNDAYTARIEAIYQEYLRTIATLPEPVFGVPRAG